MFYKEGGLCWFILAGATDYIINKADSIQTGYVHFQERVKDYQEIFVSLNRYILYILLQGKEL